MEHIKAYPLQVFIYGITKLKYANSLGIYNLFLYNFFRVTSIIVRYLVNSDFNLCCDSKRYIYILDYLCKTKTYEVDIK